MLIDRNRETLFGFVLADYVLVKKAFDFAGLGKRRPRGNRFCLLIVSDDLIADVYALIANVDRRTSYQFFDFILRLTTERTA